MIIKYHTNTIQTSNQHHLRLSTHCRQEDPHTTYDMNRTLVIFPIFLYSYYPTLSIGNGGWGMG